MIIDIEKEIPEQKIPLFLSIFQPPFCFSTTGKKIGGKSLSPFQYIYDYVDHARSLIAIIQYTQTTIYANSVLSVDFCGPRTYT